MNEKRIVTIATALSTTIHAGERRQKKREPRPNLGFEEVTIKRFGNLQTRCLKRKGLERSARADPRPTGGMKPLRGKGKITKGKNPLEKNRGTRETGEPKRISKQKKENQDFKQSTPSQRGGAGTEEGRHVRSKVHKTRERNVGVSRRAVRGQGGADRAAGAVCCSKSDSKIRNPVGKTGGNALKNPTPHKPQKPRQPNPKEKKKANQTKTPPNTKTP